MRRIAPRSSSTTRLGIAGISVSGSVMPAMPIAIGSGEPLVAR
jgi:hypothetical protein